MRLSVTVAFLFLGAAFAQNAPKPAPPPLFEITTHISDDTGQDEQGVLVRVFPDGATEYTTTELVQEPFTATSARIRRVSTLHAARLPRTTVDRLAALLNDPAMHRLKPSYPAWHQWGFWGITLTITFRSGSVPYTTTTANVFPVPKDRRQEYPGALLQLVCAGFDLRTALDPAYAPKDERQGCDEFPRLARPARP